MSLDTRAGIDAWYEAQLASSVVDPLKEQLASHPEMEDIHITLSYGATFRGLTLTREYMYALAGYQEQPESMDFGQLLLAIRSSDPRE